MDQKDKLEYQEPAEQPVTEPQPDSTLEELNLEQFSEEDDGPSMSVAKKAGSLVFEIVKVVFISLAIILPIRYFLVQPFYVQGASMEQNFYDKEYLIINEISYRFETPKRGEVVILKDPEDRKVYFIKRVIGLPGDKLEIKQGRVYVNDELLEETYIQNFSNDYYGPVNLKYDEYFVMGDNRNNSYDSRRLGPIKRGDIIGKVWLRVWPFDRFNTFNAPEYK
ncbi:MAG: signal peptidase I [Patescibacteria group bacterium]